MLLITIILLADFSVGVKMQNLIFSEAIIGIEQWLENLEKTIVLCVVARCGLLSHAEIRELIANTTKCS